MEYKKFLLDEVFICVKHLKFSYSDVMQMPTYQRRFFIITLQNQISNEEEANANKTVVTKTGKHTRTIKS